MSRRYIQNCTGGKQNPKFSLVLDFISRVVFNILFIAFLVVLNYILFFSHVLEITDVKIVGNEVIGTEEIEKTFDEYAQKKILNILPRNNFLLISEHSVRNLLLENFKRIKSVEVVKKFPQSVEIKIQERKALLIWCSGQDCFFIDEDGDAYAKVDFSLPEIAQNDLIKIDDLSASAVNVGESITNPSYEQYVLDMKKALENIGFDPTSYHTPSRVADEINVRTQQGPEFYFSTQFPLDSAMRAFSVVLEKEIPEDQHDNVAYFDLRSENKVFYKFKQMEVENAQENAPENFTEENK